MSQALFLFDDATTRDWNPFTLTRPVGELFFGALLLRERSESYWSCRCLGHVTGSNLAGFSVEGSPPAVLPESIGPDGYRIFQNSRVALSEAPPALHSSPSTLYLQGKVVGWALPPGTPSPPPELFEAPEPIPGTEPIDLLGTWLSAPFELMARNPDQLREDVPALFPGYAADKVDGCHILGNGLLSLGSRVQIEPGSVFDVRNGPIRLADGVVVKSQTRLEGPAFIGAHSTLLGGSLSEITVGPVCKVRGEVESSIILGYSNKAHDGFLGHAYLGSWVNLGAFTTNSDLKNNYGPVRIGSPDGVRETGLMKVGCFLGDHVKTGIGTYLNTGTVVGAGSNIFGGRMPPTYVPPFSWGTGEDLTEFRLDKFLEVATRAMGRRDVQLDPEMKAVLTRAFESTRPLRDAKGSGNRERA